MAELTLEQIGQVPGTPERRRRHPGVVILLAVILCALGVGAAAWWARDIGLSRAHDTIDERLTLYASTVQSALDRYRYLPYVVARAPAIQRVLAEGAAEPANRYLDAVATEAGAEALYVMDRDGLTVAASNWRERLSFVGHNYAFRPYFRDAMAGREGGFFAIGVTTGKPGYFISRPIREAGEIIGVAVVKISLAELQSRWRAGGGIPAQAQASLFDPFFTTKAPGEGVGLGLAISERIVHALGGRITAANREEGGAVFRMILSRRSRRNE